MTRQRRRRAGPARAASRPATYPRGGRVHLRLWLAERLADELGAANLAGRAVDAATYARALGAKVGDGRRPALGPAGDRAAAAGRRLLGRARGRPDAATGSTATCCTSARSRSAPAPGSAPAAPWARAPTSARDAEVAPGSAVLGARPGRRVLVRLAGRAGLARRAAPGPPSGRGAAPAGRWRTPRSRRGASRCSPLLAVAGRAARRCTPALRTSTGLGDAAVAALRAAARRPSSPRLRDAGGARRGRRAAARRWGSSPGHHPVHSRRALQAWATLRVLDEARTWLFPLYASTLTPAWLRLLGARIGSDVEASTVLLIPQPDRRSTTRRSSPTTP